LSFPVVGVDLRDRQAAGQERDLRPCDAIRTNKEEIGAGEGIRTLDPDLGKVVLYP
jgi:hypothetical protein